MELRIYSIVLLCLLVSMAGARSNKERRKDKITAPDKQILKRDICDTSVRDSPLHCYCAQEQEHSSACCWVFYTLTPDSPIWSSFSSHSQLDFLEFSARSEHVLTFVPVKALRQLRNLKRFVIKYGDLSELVAYSFANMSTLQEINLSSNQIFHLKEFSVSHLPNLTTFNLRDNKISELKRNVFYDLPSLRRLDISRNNISVVHDGAFKHLRHLHDLELGTNFITTLTKESFEGLGNLRRLNLTGNKLNMLGDYTFGELAHLAELYLDNNDLQFIAERAFDGLTHLRELSICENSLSTLPSGIFVGADGLISLDLQDNRLDVLTFETIRPIIDNLKNATSYINLEGNNFDCDCRLSWMHMLRNETRSEKVRQSLEQVTCHVDLSDNEHLVPVLKQYRDKYNQPKLENEIHHPSNPSYHHNGQELDQDAYDSGNRDESYDEQQDSTYPKTTPNNVINLMHLPMNMLPCSTDDSTDAPLSPLSQGEVRDYRNGGTVVKSGLIWLALLMMAF